MNKEFLEKLLTIQTNIQVTKNKRNEFGEFNFRSAEDILKALKPFQTQLKLLVFLDDEIVCKDGKYYVEATATITDGENSASTKASAREPDAPKPKTDASQTTGSTSSYARKYALSGLLGLDDGIDSDVVNNKPEKTTKLITKTQLSELKKLGFDDQRLANMAAYYKVESVDKITYAQADEAIKKQKKKQEKTSGGA